jgi:hypothetical protein
VTRENENPTEEGALPGFEAAAGYVELGPEGTLGEVSPHGRLGHAARRTLFRVLRPYTVRHREFERSILTALAALDAKIDGLRQEVADGEAEVFDRIEGLERRLQAFEAVTDRAIRRITDAAATQHASPPERETQ